MFWIKIKIFVSHIVTDKRGQQMDTLVVYFLLGREQKRQIASLSVDVKINWKIIQIDLFELISWQFAFHLKSSWKSLSHRATASIKIKYISLDPHAGENVLKKHVFPMPRT